MDGWREGGTIFSKACAPRAPSPCSSPILHTHTHTHTHRERGWGDIVFRHNRYFASIRTCKPSVMACNANLINQKLSIKLGHAYRFQEKASIYEFPTATDLLVCE